jgi:hypothetical protein
MLRLLLRPLWLLLALLFLFEAWLWSHLAPIVAWVVNLVALPGLKARAAAWIERLPPSVTLLVFLVPVVLLLPIKLLGFWMLAHGSWLGAMVTLALAKVVSMGVTAFIFDVTRPKLLQLAWFRWLYERVIAGLAWAHRLVDPFKEQPQNRCTACGANSPIAMKPMPSTPRPAAMKLSTTMPVMTVADARTMPI